MTNCHGFAKLPIVPLQLFPTYGSYKVYYTLHGRGGKFSFMNRSKLLVIYRKSKLPMSSQCIMLSNDRDVVNELHTSAANAEISVSSYG